MYKLIISEELKREIDYMHKTFPGTEWSGVLGYSISSGTLNGKDTVFVGLGLYPMDVGTSASTSFKHNTFPIISKYFMEKFKDENILFGSIHTHHTMGAFISGVDKGEIEDNTSVFNNYLFLVVDTRESYVAKIGRKKVSLLSEERYVDELGQWSTITKNLSINEVVIHDVSVEIEGNSKVAHAFLEVVDKLKSKINEKAFYKSTKFYGTDAYQSTKEGSSYKPNYTSATQTTLDLDYELDNYIGGSAKPNRSNQLVDGVTDNLIKAFKNGLLSSDDLFLCYLFDVNDYIDIDEFSPIPSRDELKSLIETAIHNALVIEDSLSVYLNKVNIDYVIALIEDDSGVDFKKNFSSTYNNAIEKLNKIIHKLYNEGEIDSKTFHRFKRDIGG